MFRFISLDSRDGYNSRILRPWLFLLCGYPARVSNPACETSSPPEEFAFLNRVSKVSHPGKNLFYRRAKVLLVSA